MTTNPLPPEFAVLAKNGTSAVYRKGETILRPGDEPSHFYIILEGIVKVYVLNTTGEEYVHVLYGQGEFFPFTWAINETPVPLYFGAMTDCKVLRISNESMLQALTNNAAFAAELLSQITKQFLVYTARVDNLEYKYARERLAYRMLFLARRFGKKHGDAIILPQLSQHELGNMINLSRESVSRELNRFIKRGLVKYVDNSLAIIDWQGLRKEMGSQTHVPFLDLV